MQLNLFMDQIKLVPWSMAAKVIIHPGHFVMKVNALVIADDTILRPPRLCSDIAYLRLHRTGNGQINPGCVASLCQLRFQWFCSLKIITLALATRTTRKHLGLAHHDGPVISSNPLPNFVCTQVQLSSVDFTVLQGKVLTRPGPILFSY